MIQEIGAGGTREIARRRHYNRGKERMAETATYARALFYSNWTRTFVLVIGINHRSRNARFLFFHRGGITSTRELTTDGENPCSQSSFGFWTYFFSRTEPEFLPAASPDYVFGGITTLCVRGHANRVAVLSREQESGPIPPAAPPQTQDGILGRFARN